MSEKISLVQWIINRTNTEEYRKGTLGGEKHPKVDGNLIRLVGGRENLIRQARELEKDPELGVTGKIRFQWRDMGSDILKIDYQVNIVPELCKREGIEDARERQLRHIREISRQMDAVKDTWLAGCYDELKRRLLQGKEVKELEDEELFRCLNALVQIREPVWKRIFSAGIFRESKKFENEYQKKIVNILQEYSPFCEEEMSEDEALAANGILSYAQTLEWKGPLCYQLENWKIVDTKDNIYGTIINAQTLEHAKPIAISGVKRIVVIENKANYESMKYAEDILYIYCHGFFSPKEIRFLQRLCELVDKETEYFHWGDMDYGGIRIFQFNKKNVFPELIPYHMGKSDFEKAVEKGGISLEKGKREKLDKMDAGGLEELKQCILEYEMEIEQEMLLAEGWK